MSVNHYMLLARLGQYKQPSLQIILSTLTVDIIFWITRTHILLVCISFLLNLYVLFVYIYYKSIN